MTGLTIERRGETGVIVRRHFPQSPETLYRAHTEPQMLRQWLTGPEGWRMTRCEHGPDGSIRYDWADANGEGFYLTGRFLEQEPYRRLLHVERMHLPDPTPDNIVETLFLKGSAGGTDVVLTMQVPDAAIRDAMISSGMEAGMEESYLRLENLFT